jgi:hypothetical protein
MNFRRVVSCALTGNSIVADNFFGYIIRGDRQGVSCHLVTINVTIDWYFYQIKLKDNMFRPRSGHIQAILLHKNKLQLHIHYV